VRQIRAIAAAIAGNVSNNGAIKLCALGKGEPEKEKDAYLVAYFFKIYERKQKRKVEKTVCCK